MQCAVKASRDGCEKRGSAGGHVRKGQPASQPQKPQMQRLAVELRAPRDSELSSL
jgi:hypothetical protein